jgi:hypothetical protein
MSRNAPPGRRARPRNDQGRAAPAFAWSCRPHWCWIFLRDLSRLHDHEIAVGAPYPAGAGTSRSRADGLAGHHPARVDPARVQMAGLASLPSPVVARAAVPDRGARPSTTRPSPPGAHATIRWSRASTAGRPQASCRAPYRTCCTQVREASRVSRSVPRPSVVLEPAPDQPQRRAPTRVPTGGAHRARSDLPSPSPTDQREGRPKPRQPRQLARPGHSHTFRPCTNGTFVQ